MPDFVATPRAAPTIVTGTRGPENIVANRVVFDVADDIILYMPSAAPLTALTAKLRKKRTTTQRRFDWFEKDEYPRQSALTAVAAVGTTSLVLDVGQGARWAAQGLGLNTRTRELFLNTTTPGADTLTVVRGIGGGEQDMAVGDTLIILGSAYPDGADIGSLKSIQEANLFNYTQIVRTPFGFTGREINTDLYGGKDQVVETKWFGIEHEKSLEQLFFFGRRASRTGANGHEETYTGGLEGFITSNVWDVTGIQVSERAFVETLEDAMRWGRGGYLEGMGTKYLFASSRWMTEIEFWAKDRIQYRVLDKQLGLSAGEYVTTHGRVMLIKDPILDYNHPDMAFLVDLNHIRYVKHQGRDTKLLRDRQGPGIDGEQMEYLTDFGCMVELESAHTIFKGLA